MLMRAAVFALQEQNAVKMGNGNSKNDNADKEKEDDDDSWTLGLGSDCSVDDHDDHDRHECAEGRCKGDGNKVHRVGLIGNEMGSNLPYSKSSDEDDVMKGSSNKQNNDYREENSQQATDGERSSLQDPPKEVQVVRDTVEVESKDETLAVESSFHEKGDIFTDIALKSLEQINGDKVLFDDSSKRNSTAINRADGRCEKFMTIHPGMGGMDGIGAMGGMVGGNQYRSNLPTAIPCSTNWGSPGKVDIDDSESGNGGENNEGIFTENTANQDVNGKNADSGINDNHSNGSNIDEIVDEGSTCWDIVTSGIGKNTHGNIINTNMNENINRTKACEGFTNNNTDRNLIEKKSDDGISSMNKDVDIVADENVFSGNASAERNNNENFLGEDIDGRVRGKSTDEDSSDRNIGEDFSKNNLSEPTSTLHDSLERVLLPESSKDHESCENQKKLCLLDGDDSRNCVNETATNAGSNCESKDPFCSIVATTQYPIESTKMFDDERLVEDSRGTEAMGISSSDVANSTSEMKSNLNVKRLNSDENEFIQKEFKVENSITGISRGPTLQLEDQDVNITQNNGSSCNKANKTVDEVTKEDCNDVSTLSSKAALWSCGSSASLNNPYGLNVNDSDPTKTPNGIQQTVPHAQLGTEPDASTAHTANVSYQSPASKLTIKLIESSKGVNTRESSNRTLSGRALVKHTEKKIKQIVKSGVTDALLLAHDSPFPAAQNVEKAISCSSSSSKEDVSAAVTGSVPTTDSQVEALGFRSLLTSRSSIKQLKGPSISRDPAFRFISTVLENRNAKVISSSLGSTVIVISADGEGSGKKAKEEGEKNELGKNPKEIQNQSLSMKKRLMSKAKEPESYENESSSLEKNRPSLESKLASLDNTSLSLEKEPILQRDVSLSLESEILSLENRSISSEKEVISQKSEGASLSLENRSISSKNEVISQKREGASLSLENRSISVEKEVISQKSEDASLSMENGSISVENEVISQKSEGASLSLENRFVSSQKEVISMENALMATSLENRFMSSEDKIVLLEKEPISQKYGSISLESESVPLENKSTSLEKVPILLKKRLIPLENAPILLDEESISEKIVSTSQESKSVPLSTEEPVFQKKTPISQESESAPLEEKEVSLETEALSKESISMPIESKTLSQDVEPISQKNVLISQGNKSMPIESKAFSQDMEPISQKNELISQGNKSMPIESKIFSQDMEQISQKNVLISQGSKSTPIESKTFSQDMEPISMLISQGSQLISVENTVLSPEEPIFQEKVLISNENELVSWANNLTLLEEPISPISSSSSIKCESLLPESRSTSLEKEPIPLRNESIPFETKLIRLDNELILQEKEPMSQQNAESKSLPIENEPTLLEKEPMSQRNESIPLESKVIQVDDRSVLQGKEPILQQNASVLFESELVPVENKPTLLEKEPVAQKNGPISRESASIPLANKTILPEKEAFSEKNISISMGDKPVSLKNKSSPFENESIRAGKKPMPSEKGRQTKENARQGHPWKPPNSKTKQNVAKPTKDFSTILTAEQIYNRFVPIAKLPTLETFYGFENISTNVNGNPCTKPQKANSGVNSRKSRKRKKDEANEEAQNLPLGTNIVCLPDNNWMINYVLHPKSQKEVSIVTENESLLVKNPPRRESHRSSVKTRGGKIDDGKVDEAKIDWLEKQFLAGNSNQERINRYYAALKRSLLARKNPSDPPADSNVLQSLKILSVKNLASIRPNETLDEVCSYKDVAKVLESLSPDSQDMLPYRKGPTKDHPKTDGAEKTRRVFSHVYRTPNLPKRSSITCSGSEKKGILRKKGGKTNAEASDAVNGKAVVAAASHQQQPLIDINKQTFVTNSLTNFPLNSDIERMAPFNSNPTPSQSTEKAPTLGLLECARTDVCLEPTRQGDSSGSTFPISAIDNPYDKVQKDEKSSSKSSKDSKGKEKQRLVGSSKRKPNKRETTKPDVCEAVFPPLSTESAYLSEQTKAFTKMISDWPILTHNGTILVPMQNYPMSNNGWAYANLAGGPIGTVSFPNASAHEAVSRNEDIESTNKYIKEVIGNTDTCQIVGQTSGSVGKKEKQNGIKCPKKKGQPINVTEDEDTELSFQILKSECAPLSENDVVHQDENQNSILPHLSSTDTGKMPYQSHTRSPKQLNSIGILKQKSRPGDKNLIAKQQIKLKMEENHESTEKEDPDCLIAAGTSLKEAPVLTQELEVRSEEKSSPNSLAEQIAKRLFDAEKKPLLQSVFSKANKGVISDILRSNEERDSSSMNEGNQLEKLELEHGLKAETEKSLGIGANGNGGKDSAGRVLKSMLSSPGPELEYPVCKKQKGVDDCHLQSPACKSSKGSAKDIVDKAEFKVAKVSSKKSDTIDASAKNHPVVFMFKNTADPANSMRVCVGVPNLLNVKGIDCFVKDLKASINQKPLEGLAKSKSGAVVLGEYAQDEGTALQDSDAVRFKALVEHLRKPNIKAALEGIIKESREKAQCSGVDEPKPSLSTCGIEESGAIVPSNVNNEFNPPGIAPNSKTTVLTKGMEPADESSSLSSHVTLKMQDVESALVSLENGDELPPKVRKNETGNVSVDKFERFSKMNADARDTKKIVVTQSSETDRIKATNAKGSGNTFKDLHLKGFSTGIKNMSSRRKRKLCNETNEKGSGHLDLKKRRFFSRKVTLKSDALHVGYPSDKGIDPSEDDESSQYLEAAVRSIIRKSLHLVSSASLVTQPAASRNSLRSRRATQRKNRVEPTPAKSEMTINQVKAIDLKTGRQHAKPSPISSLLWRNVRYNANLIGRKRTLPESASTLFSWECLHLFNSRCLRHDRTSIIDKLQKYDIKMNRIMESYGYTRKRTYSRERTRRKGDYDNELTEKETSPTSLRATASKCPVFSMPRETSTEKCNAGDILNEKAKLLSRSFFEKRRSKLKWKDRTSNNDLEIKDMSKGAWDNRGSHDSSMRQWNKDSQHSMAQFPENTEDCSCAKVVNSIGGNVFERSIGNLARSITKQVRKRTISSTEESTCSMCSKVLQSAKELTRHMLYHLVDKAVDHSFDKDGDRCGTKRNSMMDLITNTLKEKEHGGNDVEHFSMINNSSSESSEQSVKFHVKENQIYKAQFWTKHQVPCVPTGGKVQQASEVQEEGKLPSESQTVWTPLYFDVPVKPVKWQCLNCGRNFRSIRELKLHVDECAKNVPRNSSKSGTDIHMDERTWS